MVRHTKIVCTLGPATHTEERIEALALAGMDCARLNFSHGTHDDHARLIAAVRAVGRKLGRCLAVMADLQGPKIRVGNFGQGRVTLRDGRPFTLTTEPVAGSEETVYVNYPELPQEVRPGQRLYLADGVLMLQVVSVDGPAVRTEVLRGGVLASHQGLHIPGAALSVKALTDKDRADAAFALAQGVDMIALSFVRSAGDVETLRHIVNDAGSEASVIAKIEKREALDGLTAVIQASDGVMVARGDLGVEMPLQEVPELQRRIIREAGRHGRFVITATQVLETMTTNPRPTRAEVTDIAAAVLDGTDALMLSGETATGRYPAEAVAVMADVARTTEARRDYDPFVDEFAGMTGYLTATAAAAAEAARRLNAKAVLSLTQNGMMPRLLSRHHFSMPVVAIAGDEGLLRRLALVWGVTALPAPQSAVQEERLDLAIAAAKAAGLIAPGDDVVITFGMAPRQFNTSNTIRLHRVE